jgi:hypothetical protein
MRPIIRLSVGVAVMSAILLLPGFVSPAFGSGLGPVSSRAKPTVENSMTAQFVIPSAPAGEWVLREWSYATMPPPSPTNVGVLEAQTFGSSGTISVKVAVTNSCIFQFDVRVAVGGNSSTPLSAFKWYSGLVAVIQNCGNGNPGSPRIGASGHLAGLLVLGDDRGVVGRA